MSHFLTICKNREGGGCMGELSESKHRPIIGAVCACYMRFIASFQNHSASNGTVVENRRQISFLTLCKMYVWEIRHWVLRSTPQNRRGSIYVVWPNKGWLAMLGNYTKQSRHGKLCRSWITGMQSVTVCVLSYGILSNLKAIQLMKQPLKNCHIDHQTGKSGDKNYKKKSLTLLVSLHSTQLSNAVLNRTFKRIFYLQFMLTFCLLCWLFIARPAWRESARIFDCLHDWLTVHAACVFLVLQL